MESTPSSRPAPTPYEKLSILWIIFRYKNVNVSEVDLTCQLIFSAILTGERDWTIKRKSFCPTAIDKIL